MPQATNQATKACRSGVKVANARTGCSSRSGGTAATIVSLPISKPAALGWTATSVSSRERREGARLCGMIDLLIEQRTKRASPITRKTSLVIGVSGAEAPLPPVEQSYVIGDHVAARARSLQWLVGSELLA